MNSNTILLLMYLIIFQIKDLKINNKNNNNYNLINNLMYIQNSMLMIFFNPSLN